MKKIAQVLLFYVLGLTFSYKECVADDHLYVVTLSSESTLKPVFDSGLRPINSRNMEAIECRVTNKQIQFIVEQTMQFSVYAEEVRFQIYGDDSIGEIEVITPNMNIQKASVEALKLFNVIGSPPINLPTALEKARKIPSFEPLREIGMKTSRGNVPEVRVGFLPGDFAPEAPQELYVRLGISFYWQETTHRGKLRNKPITPPPGYESVSMDPLPLAPAAPQIPIPPAKETTSPTASPSPANTPTESLAPTPSQAVDWHLLPIIIGVLALFSAFSIFFLRKK